jgi:hypothetical protein
MPENIGTPFNTQIPSLSDNADIRTALRLYHYGSNTSAPSVVPAESLAGHLQNLENTKVDTVPTPIPTSTNLDTIIATGFYTQTGTPTGLNYPSSFPGLLTVVNQGATVFQQYQVIGAPESGSSVNTLNRTHWRFFLAGAWRPWRTFIEESDFASIGDGRYYTRTEANNTFTSQTAAAATFLTIASANSRQLLTENVKTGNHTLEAADANKVVAINNSAPATVTIPNSSTFDFPIGTIINVYAMTDQEVTIAGALGVQVRNAGKIYKQFVEISLRKRGLNEWVVAGSMRSA